MLIEPVILIVVLEMSVWSLTAAVKPSQQLFHLLKMDSSFSNTNNILSRNSERDRRPTPSNILPVGDLIESENPIYDPLPSDINIKLLRRQMGRAYNKKYMSIYPPKHKKQNKEFSIRLKKGRPAHGTRPSFLKRLRSARLQDGRKVKLSVSRKERRKFQKYLWSLTFCPVKHTWKYLGIRFWPHWIKQGTCTSERSCSIPEGMRCQPSVSRQLTFLRWHCTDFKSRRGCKWIPIQYPIITACDCKC